MKTDRLYALTLYLLNHGRTSASELAERFEVWYSVPVQGRKF